MDLTIKQIKDNIRETEYKLERYLNGKHINYVKTHPGSTKYKNVITSKNSSVNDVFLVYLIREEDYDTKIHALTETLKSWHNQYYEKIKDDHDFKEFIIFLRDQRWRTWKDIARMTKLSEKHCRRVYGLK